MDFRPGDTVRLRDGTTEIIFAIDPTGDAIYPVVTEGYERYTHWGAFDVTKTEHKYDIVENISRTERRAFRPTGNALKVLEQLHNVGEEYAMNFKNIANETGLTVQQVMTACRYLASEGAARLVHGLMDHDESRVAGSGYSITEAGAKLLTIS